MKTIAASLLVLALCACSSMPQVEPLTQAQKATEARAARAQAALDIYVAEHGGPLLLQHPNEATRIVVRDGVTYFE